MFLILLAFLNLQIYFPVIFFVTNVTRHHIIIYSLQESEKKKNPEHHSFHRQISSSQPATQAPFAHLNYCNQWMKSNQQSCLSRWQSA